MSEGGSTAALREVIERFFASHPRPHCAECLAQTIGWPVGQVTMAFRGFSPFTPTRTVLDECSRCRQIRLVLTRRHDLSGGGTRL